MKTITRHWLPLGFISIGLLCTALSGFAQLLPSFVRNEFTTNTNAVAKRVGVSNVVGVILASGSNVIAGTLQAIGQADLNAGAVIGGGLNLPDIGSGVLVNNGGTVGPATMGARLSLVGVTLNAVDSPSFSGLSVSGAANLGSLIATNPSTISNLSAVLVNVVVSNIGTTITPGFYFTNPAPATLGAVQRSPSLALSGNALNTTFSHSTNVDMGIGLLPGEFTTPFGTLQFQSRIGGAAWASVGTTIDSAGNFTTTGNSTLGNAASDSTFLAGPVYGLNNSSTLFLGGSSAARAPRVEHWARTNWFSGDRNIFTNGMSSFATNGPVVIGATGWTNTFGRDAWVEFEGIGVTFELYRANGTGAFTNSATVTGKGLPLQDGARILFTAGTGISGAAWAR